MPPPRRHLTAKGASRLLSALQEAVDDDTVRAVILTGTEDVFVRYYDVGDIIKAGEALAEGVIDESAFDDAPFCCTDQIGRHRAQAGYCGDQWNLYERRF